MKKLSRINLKQILGGLEINPSGCYVCCWKDTNNCSTSVKHEHTEGSGNMTCVKNAELKPSAC
ncbi:hypothetical protein [Elizabethkingia meningoseptica]|uniref:hypothetical protein n=1 Tax=Elizabethkingia meningoseptica TaxID=238 RepID=UPI0038919270